MNDTAEKTGEVIEMDQTFDASTVPAKFGKADQIIIALEEKYKGLTEIEEDNVGQYKALKEAISDVKKHRTGFENTRKEVKVKALDYGRKVDAEGTRLKEAVSKIEDRLVAIKETEDNRLEGIRLEAERIERERVDGINAKINHIKAVGVVTLDNPLDELLAKQDELNLILINTTYEELAGVANEALLEAKKIVDLAVEHRKQRDEEDARRAEEQTKLDEEREKLDAEKVERQKADDEAADQVRKDREEFEEDKRKFEAEKQKDADVKEAEEQRIRDEQEEETRKEEAKKNAGAQERALKQREEEADRQRKEKDAKLEESRKDAVMAMYAYIKIDELDNNEIMEIAKNLIAHIEVGNIDGIKAEYL